MDAPYWIVWIKEIASVIADGQEQVADPQIATVGQGCINPFIGEIPREGAERADLQ
jgi:hypothetical protein